MISNSEIVLESRGFKKIPSTLFKNVKRADPPTKLSPTMGREEILPTLDQLPFPTIRVSENGPDRVEVRSNENRIVVKDGSIGVLETPSKEITRPAQKPEGNGVRTKVTPLIVTRYLTDLSVEIHRPKESE